MPTVDFHQREALHDCNTRKKASSDTHMAYGTVGFFHTICRMRDTKKLRHSQQKLRHSQQTLRHYQQTLRHSKQKLSHSQQRLRYSQQKLRHSQQTLRHSQQKLNITASYELEEL
jgi:hypothetical protein